MKVTALIGIIFFTTLAIINLFDYDKMPDVKTKMLPLIILGYLFLVTSVIVLYLKEDYKRVG